MGFIYKYDYREDVYQSTLKKFISPLKINYSLLYFLRNIADQAGNNSFSVTAEAYLKFLLSTPFRILKQSSNMFLATAIV
jgi:hypothetical protein